ncbi:MAG: peptidoglycan DD-metalloendopeptidase family protein [Bacteroidales bacterium]|nr:peptidoglycan DD-metalloendopeptidase family protein [Bacteroidales bacterium]
MINKFGKIAVLGLAGIAISFTTVHAQDHVKSTKEEFQIQKLESDPNLMADNISSGFELVAVDSMLLNMALKMEGHTVADELYDDMWDTEYVKAYSEVKVPDQFTIDVSEFIMPIEGRVTSDYGPRRRRFHYGTDFKLQTGDIVRAAFDGKVRVKRYERRGYGYYLVLRHPNGLETVYGHLSKFLVDQDQTVKAGEPIALGGNTGRSTGAHLHFEFRFLGQAINPGEIIDFNDFCIKDDMYVFNKAKSGKASGSKSNKYTAKGNSKIKYYKIRKNDTLGAIARRHGTTVSKICKLNNIKPTTTLRIGRSIRLT